MASSFKLPLAKMRTLFQAGLVEEPARLGGKLRQISAVETDPEPALELKLTNDGYRVPDTRDRVVSVDEKCDSSRKVLRKRAKSLELGLESFDIGVRHRARGGQAVSPSGLDIAGRRKSNHRRQARHVDPASMPCVRRNEKSTVSRPAAAMTHRAACSR